MADEVLTLDEAMAVVQEGMAAATRAKEAGAALDPVVERALEAALAIGSFAKEQDLSKARLLGHVEVDSGTIVVLDPCYIESHWRRREPAMRIGGVDRERLAEVVRGWQGVVVDPAESKHTVAVTIAPGSSLTYPELQEKMEAAKPEGNILVFPMATEGTIDRAFKATRQEACGGPTDPGDRCLGVTFLSGVGDGTYPVYAYYDKGGRVSKVVVDTGGPEC